MDIIYNFILLLINIFGLWLALWIFLSGRKQKLNIAFALMIISNLAWISFYHLAALPDWRDSSLLLFKGATASVFLFFIAYYFFIVRYFLKKDSLYSILGKLVFLYGVVFGALTILTNSIITRLEFQDLAVIPIFSKAGWLAFYGYVIFLTILIIKTLLTDYYKAEKAKKLKIQYFLIGVFIFTGLNFIFNVILPVVFKNYQFYQIGNYSTLFLIGFTSYAIIRQKLFGVRVIFSHILIYFILFLFAMFVFHYAVWVEQSIFGSVWNPAAYSLSSIIALSFIFLFMRLLKASQNISDKLFYKGYNPQEIIKNLIARLGGTISLNDTISIINEEFGKVFRLKDFNIVVLKQDDKNTICLAVLGGLAKGGKTILDNDFCFQITKYKEIILRSEITKENRLTKYLDEHSIKLIVPCLSSEKIISVLLLGEKDDKEAYTQEDINFLETIRPQIAIAIENALLHEETKEQKKELAIFNQSLEQKVDEQTEALKLQNQDIEAKNKDIQTKNKRLQELLELKNNFVQIVNHQLNTPLSVLRSSLDMIQTKSWTAEQGIEPINKNATRMSETVKDFCEAFNLEKGDDIKMNREEFEIEEIIKQLIEEKKQLPEALERKLKIKYSKPKFNLPIIFGDRSKITNAISNILDNAVYYTPKGSVTVSFKKATKKGLKQIKIFVEDTGMGLDKKDKKILFMKFARGKRAFNEYQNGSGLGLYIAQRIFEENGGEIKLEKTQVGKGATFSLSLPIHKEASRKKTDKAETGTIIKPVEGEEKPLILIIEDEKNLVNIYTDLLHSYNYEVKATEDIKEAYKIAKKDNPSLILLDIILPRKEAGSVFLMERYGYEFLKLAKKDEKVKDIPILAFTNLDTIEDREKCKRLGVKDYLFKRGIRLEDAVAMIEKWRRK